MATTSATPTETTTVTSNVPAWAQKYATDILGFGKALTYPKVNPVTGQLESGFQPYRGELVAGFSPLQQQAMSDLSRMQVAPQISQATGLTGLAALQAQQAGQYRPMQPQQYYQSPFEQRPSNPFEQGGSAFEQDMRDRLRNTEINRSLAASRSTSSLEPTSSLGGEGYGPIASPSQSFQSGAPGAFSPLQQYMSPYMQGVVEQQKSQAIADYGRQLPGMAAAAARAGAKGGTREALLQSEAQRNLQQNLQNIQATGLQNAYQQAAQQAAQDAQLRAQYGFSGQQLAEQSRQFGAGLGLQGLQQQMAAAGQLGQLGQQQYQQQAGILGAQMGAGAQQQALKQQMLSSDYQRFIDEMQYPYKQLEYMSNLIRGIPSTDKTTSTYTPFNEFAAAGGIFGSGGGLQTIFGGLGR